MWRAKASSPKKEATRAKSSASISGGSEEEEDDAGGGGVVVGGLGEGGRSRAWVLVCVDVCCGWIAGRRLNQSEDDPEGGGAGWTNE